MTDPEAQPLLWEYAQRRRKVDAEFSDDLERALLDAGHVHLRTAEERWFRYLCAAERANLARVGVAEDLHDLAILDRVHNPTITMHRDVLARLRVDHLLLVNVVTELLGLDPGTMTTGDIISAMWKRSVEAGMKARKAIEVRSFEGTVVEHETSGVSWWSLCGEEELARQEPGSCDAGWLEDFAGEVVRLTVEGPRRG